MPLPCSCSQWAQRKYALLLTLIAFFEPEGRGFESLPACHFKLGHRRVSSAPFWTGQTWVRLRSAATRRIPPGVPFQTGPSSVSSAPFWTGQTWVRLRSAATRRIPPGVPFQTGPSSVSSAPFWTGQTWVRLRSAATRRIPPGVPFQTVSRPSSDSGSAATRRIPPGAISNWAIVSSAPFWTGQTWVRLRSAATRRIPPGVPFQTGPSSVSSAPFWTGQTWVRVSQDWERGFDSGAQRRVESLPACHLNQGGRRFFGIAFFGLGRIGPSRVTEVSEREVGLSMRR